MDTNNLTKFIPTHIHFSQCYHLIVWYCPSIFIFNTLRSIASKPPLLIHDHTLFSRNGLPHNSFMFNVKRLNYLILKELIIIHT